jgi:hypothetical protein
MGWTGVRARAGVSRLDMLASCSSFSVGHSWDTSDATIVVEDLKSAPGGVYGVLRKTIHATGKILRFALVVLTETKNGEFFYKELTEYEGPTETRYPLSFLKRLSPPEELASGASLEYIQNWRQRVEANGKKGEALKSVKPGSFIVFNEPVRFVLSGEEVHIKRFQVVEWGRRKVFVALPVQGAPFRCRLSRDLWTYREYVVES